MDQVAYATCARFDGNHDHTVAINELVSGTGNSLSGCKTP
jgi:hypothetical protein